jgi:hypothetical protein
MKSPFEKLALSVNMTDLFSIQDSVSEDAILNFFIKQKMQKYLSLHLTYRQHLDSSTSEPVKTNDKNAMHGPCHHRFNENVGILMVGKKRPIHVRFAG